MDACHRPAPSLRLLQHWMSQRIVEPERLEHMGESAIFDALFERRGRIDPRDGFGAHANGYPARIHDALAEVFPAVAHAVGSEGFFRLAERFRKTSPPRCYNLNHAGAEFPAFLRWEPVIRQLPFLGDLAELEWRIAEAFHARVETPLDPASLADWSPEDWERATFVFQPGTAIVSSTFPVREIWKLRSAPRAEIDVPLEGRHEHVVVRRRDLEVRLDAVSAEEAATLRSLLAGRRLGDVIERLEHAGIDASAVTSWFGRWNGLGLVIGCARGQASSP